MERLAAHPNGDVAASLLDPAPASMPARARPRYTELLLQVAGHPTLQVRKRALTAVAAWAPGAEALVAGYAARTLVNLEGAPEWREAAAALAGAIRDGKAWEPALAAVRTLVATRPTPETNAAAGRDLPARQRLGAFLQLVLGWPPVVRRARKERLLAAAELLRPDASLWSLRARLKVLAEDFGEPAAPAATVLELARESAHEPLAAPALAAAVELALAAAPVEAAAALAIAEQVKSAAPLAALALVAAAGQRTQWSPPAAELLRGLRTHPTAAIREAACAVHTASE